MRNWLIEARKAAGISQKDMADRVHIAQPSYCNIEKGKRSPSIQTAKAIADVLGIEWTRFYEAV